MSRHFELLVEDASMEAALNVLLPKFLPIDEITFCIHAHRGKQDLLTKLQGKLRAYAGWAPEHFVVVALVDRDEDDCTGLKRGMTDMQVEAAARQGGRHSFLARIAIEELEAWFFGDWEAVGAAYPGVDKGLTRRKGFRNPDEIQGGTWERLLKELKRGGHYRTLSHLPKIESARSIAEHMDPFRNTSTSFRAFRDGLLRFVSPSA